MNKILYEEGLRQHVIDNLQAIGGIQKNNEIYILCAFHNDHNPSLGVHIGHNVPPGTFHCWSCKASGGWNKLAKALSLPFYANLPDARVRDDTDPFEIMARSYNTGAAFKVEGPAVLRGLEELPRGFRWRNLGKNFLDKFGAKFYWQKETKSNVEMDWLYFPLTMNAAYKGYTVAALRPHKPKYMTFADTQKVLFLYDYIPAGSPLVLVEGHADALRLHAEGIPATAIFGTANWGEIKREFIKAKMPRRVLVLFDGDEAGRTAAQRVFIDLRAGTDVDIFYLPEVATGEEKIDPGNMPIDLVTEVQRRLYR